MKIGAGLRIFFDLEGLLVVSMEVLLGVCWLGENLGCLLVLCGLLWYLDGALGLRMWLGSRMSEEPNPAGESKIIGLMVNFGFLGAGLGLLFCVAGGGWVGGVVGVVSIGVELVV